MLYRSRRSASTGTFIILVVLGVLAGAGFFYYDNYLSTPAVTPTATAVAEAQVAAPVVTPIPSLPPVTNTPVANVVAPEPDTTLFIPSLAVYSPVITAIIRDGTWDVDNLGTNVGYLQGTSWLGEGSNTVLSGHVEMSDGRTGVFSTLRDIALGDQIVVTENDTEFRYVVRELHTVRPNDLSVVQPTTDETLTLITCSTYNFLRNTYDERFVVVAERIS